MPSGCRMGICHSCVAPLRWGQVGDLRTGVVHGEEGELIQTCISGAAGDGLSRAYEVVGFDTAAGADEVFRSLVLARIIEATG